ncbi:MAG: prolyl aminopeptidase [Elusimicrobiota bacterium]
MSKQHGLTELYPPVEPYRTGRLRVSDIHTVYYEEAGDPKGKPVIFLHGGPGGGLDPVYRRYFDPKKWRIVLFDQRGCGKSTPYNELRENTTWDLVADIERLREHLGIGKWVVFGGSWGSTLALAYSETHPTRCKGLILRGIFLLRKKEIRWFYQEGADFLFPDAWEPYRDLIPKKERRDMVRAYHKRLTGRDLKMRLKAAKTWSVWEASTSKLKQDLSMVARFSKPRMALPFARIECHYFINKGFLRQDDQLLRDARRIRHLPCVIVQGRYDTVCPMTSAWDLHKTLPKSKLIVVSDAGHSMTEPAVRSALIEATDAFARL